MSERPSAIPGVTCGHLTADLPPIGGVVRARAEDFLVDEEPLYHPGGQGEHIYLYIEKRGLSTTQVADALAKHFGVAKSAVGYAGMKDTRAVTRQVFSVHTPGKTYEDFPDLAIEGAAALWADMHANKLRVGHLKGNRFSIRIRGVRATDARTAWAVLERLESEGVPNFLGEQRFGARAANHDLGRLDVLGRAPELLDSLLGPGHDDDDDDVRLREARGAYARGDFGAALRGTPRRMEAESAALRALARGEAPDRAVRAIPGRVRQLWANALQSFAFNRVLSERLDAGSLGALRAGDLAWKHENGAVFQVDDATASDPGTLDRLARVEISPSGPLWGPSMTQAAGAAGASEDAALASMGVSLDDIGAWSKRTRCAAPGARRPLRVPLLDPDAEGGVDEHGEYVRVAFELPAGAFATAVLREIMKPELAAGSGARSVGVPATRS